MVFPADKETWPVRVTDDLIPAEDHNDWATFLETLQDTLGVNFISGYASLKLKLDDWQLIFKTKEVQAIDSNGLLLRNDNSIGIAILDTDKIGIRKLDPEFDVDIDGQECNIRSNTTQIQGTVKLNGSIFMNGGLETVITLEKLGIIGQAEKGGIVGANELVDNIIQSPVQNWGGVWHCIIDDGTNYRLSIIKAIWKGASISFTEINEEEIGTTTPLTLAVTGTDTDIKLEASASSGTWNVRVTRFLV